jgi:hypothetical protein
MVSAPNRSILLLVVGACTFGAAPSHATAPNVLEIVVVNGPFAGTSKPPVTEVICVHAKKQRVYATSWKNPTARDPRATSEGGLSVSNPDEAGAKSGDVRIAFGDPDRKPVVYDLNQVPMTQTIPGQGADISFQGRTRDGIQLRISANCADVEEV